MKFCSHCGKQIDENAVVCTSCGCSLAPIKRESNVSFLNLEFLLNVALYVGMVLVIIGGVNLLSNLIYWLFYITEMAFDSFQSFIGYNLLSYFQGPLICVGTGFILMILAKKK